MVKQTMLAQSFAMVGGHDHQRSIEHAAALQFVEQLSQPLVQISKAIVIAIYDEGSVVLGQLRLVDVAPMLKELEIGVASAASAQSGTRLLGEAGSANGHQSN